MKLHQPLIDELMVRPGHAAALSSRSTSETTTDWLRDSGLRHPREVAERDLATYRAELASAQEVLYASHSWALLVVIQALDAAGKDGTISHVMTGVNPQGCSVTSFKQPSAEELDHDFLWRCAKALPERGRIGIFNRSYYEEVLVTRVHPEFLAREHLPDGPRPNHPEEPPKSFWHRRYEDINAFERHLTRNGTRIVKLFLHVSKEVQRQRFLERLENPAKHWKFSAADLAESAHFDEYQQAYEDALTATSTEWAPWYVVPADHKYAMRALVGGVLVHVVEQLDLRYPELDPEQRTALDTARQLLVAEETGSGDNSTRDARR